MPILPKGVQGGSTLGCSFRRARGETLPLLFRDMRMDRLQEFFNGPLMLTAAATVAADEALTLLAANPAFRALVGEAFPSRADNADSLLPLFDADSGAALVRALAQGPASLETESVIQHKDGSRTRVLLFAARLKDLAYHGVPLYLLGLDNLSRKEDLRRHLASKKRKFDLITDITDDIPFEYDYETDTITYGEKYRTVFGHAPITARFRARLNAGEATDPVSDVFRDAFLSPEKGDGARLERLLPMRAGEKRWYALLGTLLRDAENRPVKAVGVLRDIDVHKREQLRLLDKSRSDPLTGLFNKTTTEEEIRIALRDARPGRLGVLFMIDVDNFKNVNDNMGHLAGDSILCEIARQIAAAFRKGDVIGRVGGDEFHVYMRDVDDSAVVRDRAEKLCDAIRALFAHSKVDKSVSVSVGIAVTEEAISYEDLFRQADIALYQAKACGKNRFRFFGQRDDAADGEAPLPAAPNGARNGIMVDLIDILFRMCDMQQGVEMALDFIGKTLRVDRIAIFERSLDETTVSITHEWCADPAWSDRDAFQNVPAAHVSLPEASEPGGVYYCSDLAALPPEKKTFLRDPSISSLLQAEIRREGRTFGHISFEERGPRRIWTQQEVDTLILLSRILGECIRQRRASVELREHAESTRKLLDSLLRTAVYVIDHDRRLLYFNETVIRAFPHVRAGMTCHEVFWGRGEICSFCPVRDMGDRDSFTTILQHSPFTPPSDISVSRILWEKRPAWVVLISEHLLSQEEEAERKKRETLARALCQSYSHVVDLEIDGGFYETLAGEYASTDEDFPPAGDYVAQFPRFERRLHEHFRQTARERFSLTALREAYEAGTQCQMEYLFDAGGGAGLRWQNRVAFPWSPGDGSRHMLQCVRDVHERKRREIKRRREEENVRLALQNSYANICRLDLDDNAIDCLFSDPNLLAPSDLTGNFREDNRRLAEKRIHPDESAAFLRFFDPALLRERLARGEQPSMEYRKRAADGAYRWLLSLVVALPSSPGKALLLVRDITESKEKEADYLLALQSNYAEIFLLDLAKGLMSPLYKGRRAPASSCDFAQFAKERFRLIDPDFIEAARDFYDLRTMPERLGAGRALELEYRIRMGENAPYRWTAAALRPLPGDGGHAMLLLRDVTALRDEENNFYRVLQSSYTEIYEASLDGDTMRGIYRADDAARFPLTQRYREDIHTLSAFVHPEDRKGFLLHYDPDHIRRGIAEGKRQSIEYRSRGADGSYRWRTSLILPLPGAATRFLILCQDISERKRMEATTLRLERRQSEIFRQSWDSIIEVDLHTGRFVRNISSPTLPAEPRAGDYAPFFHATLDLAHPEDRGEMRRTFAPDALLAAYQNRRPELTARYRMLESKGYRWFENRVFFLDEDESVTAFFLIRDISAQKELEAERAREEQRFSLALRNTYSEIYEIDLLTDRPHLVYASGAPMIPLDRDPDADIRSVMNTLVHPDDSENMFATFNGEHVRALFAAGQQGEIEYRRLGEDGAWHWCSACVVPLCVQEACETDRAMLLVRDVTERRAQEQRQRISEQYDRALRNIYDELYELNVSRDAYRIVYHAESKYVTPPEEGRLSDAVPLVAQEMIHPEDKERFLEFFKLEAVRERFAAGRECLIGEFRKLWRDGVYHWASLTMFPVAQPEGDDEIYLVFIMDIGEKKQAEEIAQQNVLLERQRLDDERYRTIIEQTDTLVFEWHLENHSRYVSPEIGERFAGNYDERDIMHIWRDDGVIHADDLPKLARFLKETRTNNYTEMTARFKRRRGDYIWCKVALTCLRDENGAAKRYIGTLNDVDAATRSVLALKYRAEFDLLTDIYNMHTFYGQTEQLLHAHPERRYSIIRMDIDRFKVINDLYGLKEGDKLLIAIARLLREKLTGHGVYGRLGGDVFCLCVDYPRERILELIAEITERLAAYPLPYKVVPSFGICEVDNIDTPINVLCDWANLALKTIKGNYLNSYAFYDGKLREHILEEKKIENQMHDALLQGQFVLYLQPKVHIPTSRIAGSEGLVRWIHPVEGLMPPDRFIPLFERNGFIIRLDEYIWEQACITLRRWLDHGLDPAPISVNMSRMHIHDPRLREKLLDLVRRYDLPPRLLELELTESAFLENESGLFKSMTDLQSFGFQFSMDDFGSGYSSLNMLKSMPVDFLKIDRGFLNEVVATDRGKTVIRFSISLAKEMDIKVIAEGVETEEQAAFLLQAGCAYAQGYFYSRPLPIGAFEDLAFGPKQPPFPVAPRIRSIAKVLEEAETGRKPPRSSGER